MGRDMSVLQTWNISGKPPLLGPQTSALPFNQSAIYFYSLYPGYLISRGNPISLVYTLAFVYILSFIIGSYLLRKEKNLPKILFIVFFLISIHPQYITQGRYVWNPSFVSPFIISAIISFYLLIKKFFWPTLWLFSASIATAISFSYSVTPLLIAIIIYWLIFNRQKFFHFFITLFTSLIALNIPTIFFELRHQFLLTTSIFSKQSPVQNFLSFNEKITNLSTYIFSTPHQQLNIFLLTSFFILCLYLIYRNYKKTNSLQFISAFLFLTLIILTLLTPVTVQAHYIFAFTCLIFILIATFKNIYIYSLLFFFSIIYLQPLPLNSYFKDASRTYSQMQTCYKNYCQTHPDPTFVSVQSNFHPFHNGPEHRYLLRNALCNVKEIETENGQAKYMSVILDNGTFDEKTNYYELELFGIYKDIETFDCLPNFKIKVLEKI
jgi:hypothetical protein